MLSTNPEREIEIDILVRVLSDLPIRETVSYRQLSDAVGYDVQDRPFALLKARRRAEEQTGMRFGTVRRVGVRKLDGEAVSGLAADARRAIARRAGRQAKRLTGLRYNDITAAQQQRIDAERSLLGAISAMAKTAVERVEVLTQTGPIVAARVFDVMNRHPD